jgi:hypothetical protein
MNYYAFLKGQSKFTLMGKIRVKGATQVSGHSLKLHFCMFGRSQGKHNNLIVINVFGIFSINCKVWHKSKMFLHIQSIQTLKVDSLCFFQMFFFSTKCAPFLLKIGKYFNIDY